MTSRKPCPSPVRGNLVLNNVFEQIKHLQFENVLDDFRVFDDEEEELPTDSCADGREEMLGAGEVVCHKPVNTLKDRILVQTTFQDIQDFEWHTYMYRVRSH